MQVALNMSYMVCRRTHGVYKYCNAAAAKQKKILTFFLLDQQKLGVIISDRFPFLYWYSYSAGCDISIVTLYCT